MFDDGYLVLSVMLTHTFLPYGRFPNASTLARQDNWEICEETNEYVTFLKLAAGYYRSDSARYPDRRAGAVESKHHIGLHAGRKFLV